MIAQLAARIRAQRAAAGQVEDDVGEGDGGEGGIARVVLGDDCVMQ